MSRTPIRLAQTVVIALAPSTVWNVIANSSNDRHWRDGVLEITRDPAGLPQNGARVHEELRMAGRTYVNDLVLSDVVDGSHFHFTGTGTSGDIHGFRRVWPGNDPNSSAFTYEIELTLRGAIRVISPLVAARMSASLRKNLDSLKRQLEEDSFAATGFAGHP